MLSPQLFQGQSLPTLQAVAQRVSSAEWPLWTTCLKFPLVRHTRETALDFIAVFCSYVMNGLDGGLALFTACCWGLPLSRTGFSLAELGPQVAPGSCQVLTRDSWHS